MSRNNYLAEAFKSMRSDDILNEEAFTLDSKGADELKQFLDGDAIDDTISVIDPDAETPEELEDSYIGKVILDCCVCHSKLYKDKDEVVIDEDGDLANVDEECPFCYCVDGFKIVGEVKEFDKDDSDDDENGEKDDNDEKDEVEVEETEEDEKIEESVSAKRSARMKKKLREGNASSFAKNLIDIEKEARTLAVLKPEESPDEILDSVIEGLEEPLDAVKYYYGNSTNSIIRFLKDVGIYDRLKKQLKSSVTELLKTNKLVPDEVAAKWDVETNESLKEGKKLREGLSYGELVAIEDEWKKFKEKKGDSSAETAREFIETECKGVYDTDEEKEDVFAYISAIEEPVEVDEGRMFEKKKLREAPSYELHPQYDSRKSFYGKARVDTGDKSDKNKLFSYDTLVAEIKDGKPVVYGAFSATTLRHIKDWLKQNGFKAENKAQILRDYGVKAEAKECKGKKCNIREGKRRKGECKLTEAKEYTAETLAKDIKDAVDWLVGEQEGCVTLKLDDKLAVCVGWSGGYGKEKRDDVIQSTEDPDYAINAGIKVWTSDDMRTDYDWINYPYYKNGDIEDTGLSLEANEDYTNAAEWLLGEYDRMSNYEISDDGEIVEETEETIEESKKVNESVEEVSVKTDKEDISVRTSEDGKVSVETSVREETDEGAEEIAPVSDEVKAEIEDGSEEAEIGDEIDVDMTDFDEESFDELGEAYLKKAYSNVESYKSVSATANDNRITVEGVIKFKSGNEKKTKFVLESKEVTRSGKSRFVGENLQIAKGKKAFTVFGTLSEGRFVTESLGYDYRAKDKNGKSKRISGTVTKR